jgi:vacuolar-type H+-ATPase subunit H
MLSEAAMTYAMKLLDEVLQGASEGQDKIEELSDEAAKTLKTATETTRKAARKTQDRATRAVRDVIGKVKR